MAKIIDLGSGGIMAAYRFVIKDNALRRITAGAGFAAEAFEDVTVTFGAVNDHGTYPVTFSSASQASLDQACLTFRNLARAQRAIVGEGATG
jgi:hypothetical protein